MVLWNTIKALLAHSTKSLTGKWCDGGDGAEPTKLVIARVTQYSFSDETVSYYFITYRYCITGGLLLVWLPIQYLVEV